LTGSKQERASAIRFIVCLGFVSLFADATYEGAYSIIGPFLKDLGASATQVGIIAGLGEMIAASLRFISGRFADRTRAYWSITMFGYVLNLLVVPALAFAGNGPAFLWLAIPAVGAFGALLAARLARPKKGVPPPPQTQKRLPRIFWIYVVAAGMLALGFVDFPLLAYHFQKTALAKPAAIPLYYAGAMGVNGLAAVVFGRLYDRYGIAVLSLSIPLSLLALPLGFLGGAYAAIASVACWAIGLGAQDACLRSGIAQLVSMNKRGSAFGAFNGVFGVMWFLGSATMGLLYDHSLLALVLFGMVAQLIATVPTSRDAGLTYARHDSAHSRSSATPRTARGRAAARFPVIRRVRAGRVRPRAPDRPAVRGGRRAVWGTA